MPGLAQGDRGAGLRGCGMKLSSKIERADHRLALVMTEPEQTVAQPPPVPDITPVYWTPEQMAAHYQVPIRWIYGRARLKGPERLPHLRMGKYIRININSEQFKDWLARHEV